MHKRILEQRGLESTELFRALGCETRVRILGLLAEGDRNIHELGLALGITQPSVTKHVQALEQAGLVASEYMSGIQGMQKRCRLCFDRVVVSFEIPRPSEGSVEEVEMPIGLYTAVGPDGPCGLANTQRIIGFLDKPQSFYHPERATAQLLWMADGFVEYLFPNTLPTSAAIHRLELAMEVCSEAPNHASDYPSDISVWVNGVEVGTWTSPGDPGGKRGRLNPLWWSDHMSQYGLLKLWLVDGEGAYVDGVPVSGVTVDTLGIVPQQPICVRIGIRPDAAHPGGFNLFGHGFGNYEQDLILRLHYQARGRDGRGTHPSAMTANGGDKQ